MPDIAAIAGVMSSLRAMADLTNAAVDLRDAEKFRSKAIELQSEIMSAQKAVMDAHMAQAGLLEEIRQLKAEATSREDWKTQASRYRLQELPPGVFVYALKEEAAEGEPFHRTCAPCYAKGHISVLHTEWRSEHLDAEHLRCHACSTKLLIRWAQPNHNKMMFSGWSGDLTRT